MGSRLLKEKLDWICKNDKSNYTAPISPIIQDIFEFNYGKKVIELKSGDFFGEKALDNSAPRNATIITTTNCDFIILKKKDYNSKLKKAFKKKQEQLLQFYDNVLQIGPVNFKENKYVYSIMRSFEEKNCCFGEIVQNHIQQRCSILLLRRGIYIFLYIIIAWKFLMYKTIHSSETDSDFYKSFTNLEKEKIFSILSGKKIKICEIFGNAVVGEEILIDKDNKMDVSVDCLSVNGAYLKLKEGALSNLPGPMKKDLVKVGAVRRKTRIQQFERLIRLMIKSFCKIPKRFIDQYVRPIPNTMFVYTKTRLLISA